MQLTVDGFYVPRRAVFCNKLIYLKKGQALTYKIKKNPTYAAIVSDVISSLELTII